MYGNQTDKVKIQVYIDTGVVFEYEVNSPEKAREHMAKIITTGYRSTPKDSTVLTWWPPHRIDKVVADGAAESTNYSDTPRAT